MTKRLAVLCASHNRRETTLRGVNSLKAALERVDDLSWQLFLVDDASSDGTAEAVAAALPEATIIPGTGDLFWNRAMCLAYERACIAGPWDAFLLFNDDVEVLPDAAADLVTQFILANRQTPAVYVGATRSPINDRPTYGGYLRKSSPSPLGLRKVFADGSLREIDSFNGNFVLLPADAFHSVGGLNPAFHHGYGDIDLGYRLARAGIPLRLGPESVGLCADKADTPLQLHSFGVRWRKAFGPPMTLGQRFTFLRQHSNIVLALLLTAKHTVDRAISALKGG